jgi:Tfp pilus assembly protein PilF
MWNKAIRIGLTAAIFIWSIYQFIEGNIGNGIFFVLVSGLVLLTYFKNENITLALWYLRKQDMAKTKKALLRIKNPEKALVKSQLAYYYLLMGMLESQNGLGKAETLLRKALSTGLRLKQDQALAKLNLAGIALSRRRKREAQMLLTEVKKLDDKKVLDEQVKAIKAQLGRI